MSFWPEKAWWSGQTSFWSQQPVAHAMGGLAGAAGLISLLLAPWWAKPPLMIGGLGFYWQLRVWEPQPDGTYPFRWVVYDVLTNVVFASVVTAAAILLGLRW